MSVLETSELRIELFFDIMEYKKMKKMFLLVQKVRKCGE